MRQRFLHRLRALAHRGGTMFEPLRKIGRLMLRALDARKQRIDS